MIKYLNNHPLTGQILQCDGRWNFVYGFFAKDIFELRKEVEKFEKRFGKYIVESAKITHIGSHHYFRGYLLGKEEIRENEPFLGWKEDILILDDLSCQLPTR